MVEIETRKGMLKCTLENLFDVTSASFNTWYISFSRGVTAGLVGPLSRGSAAIVGRGGGVRGLGAVAVVAHPRRREIVVGARLPLLVRALFHLPRREARRTQRER